METNRIQQIREALTGAGLGWIFADDADERARALAEEFDQAQTMYNQRYATKIDLLENVRTSGEKYLPFLQSIGLPLSTEMRLIILRLVEDTGILEMDFKYRRNGASRLEVLFDGDPDTKPIIAEGRWDALILKKLGCIVTEDGLELHDMQPWESSERKYQ